MVGSRTKNVNRNKNNEKHHTKKKKKMATPPVPTQRKVKIYFAVILLFDFIANSKEKVL